jgi:hypothetical protein
MGGLLTQIFGGGLGTLVKDVVGTFKLAPEDKLKFEQAIAANEHEIQMKEYELTVKAMDAESKAIEAASKNIQAEATSGDKFTSRARPTFMYLFYIILTFNYIILPISQMIAGVGVLNLKPIEFPMILWEVFTAGFLGYTGVRTFEKYSKGAK